jgi:predicted  nucleic acid-binding Zn-ribbon protein
MLLLLSDWGTIIGHHSIGERMTEHKHNPEETLENMFHKNVKFTVAEVVSGGAAVVGTLVLVGTKNAAMIAAIPLTLSVALNLFNRRNLDRLTRQQALFDSTEVQRRFASEMYGTRSRSLEGAGDVDVSGTEHFEAAIASLSQTVAALETQIQLQQGSSGSGDTSQIAQELVQLRNHQLDLSQSLEAVNQQLRSLPAESGSVAFDSSAFEHELSVLNARISEFQSSGVEPSSHANIDLDTVRTEFQNLLNPVQLHLSDLESRWSQQPVQSELPVAAPVDIEPLRAELLGIVTPVQEQLASVEARIASQPTPEVSGNHSEELQGVQGQVSALNEKLEHIAAQLSAEIAGFQQSIEHTQDRVQAVHQTVQDAQVSALASVPDSSSLEADLQAAVGPLREQVAALQNQLSSMPKVDPNVSQLQSEQMISLQNQLNSTNGLIEEVAAQLTSELSKIPQLIDEKVDHKVATLPTAAPEPKKDAFSELDAILADINL